MIIINKNFMLHDIISRYIDITLTIVDRFVNALMCYILNIL